MKMHQFKIPVDQLEKITLALNILEIKNYSLFENPQSEKSNLYDKDDFPLASEFFLETNEKIEELKKMGFESHIITIAPFLDDAYEEIVVGNFVINPIHIPLYIKGSMAFGTGHHQTTQECLLALDYLKNESISSVLDLGCGSGVLAIAAQKLLKSPHVDASDIDPIAVDIAQKNCIDNQTTIQVYCSEGFDQLPYRTYDLIIANILLNPLCQLAKEIMKRSLKYVVVSGIIEEQKENLLEAFLPMIVVQELKLDDWVTFILAHRNDTVT